MPKHLSSRDRSGGRDGTRALPATNVPLSGGPTDIQLDMLGPFGPRPVDRRSGLDCHGRGTSYLIRRGTAVLRHGGTLKRFSVELNLPVVLFLPRAS